MGSKMNINGIEKIPEQYFPIEKAAQLLSRASPMGKIEEFNINYLEDNNARAVILTDLENIIAAIATFVVRINGNIWQVKNVQSYPPYKNKALAAKIYKMVKEKIGKSIQSDIFQSNGAQTLWTKTLPSIGLNPMIFDMQTDRIINPNNFDMSLLYPDSFGNDSAKFRYSWIIEKNDNYPSQNLLSENSIIMPITGMWYKE